MPAAAPAAIEAQTRTWDLSDLYASYDDEGFRSDYEAVLADARDFARRVRGQVAALAAAPARLREVLREREDLLERSYRLGAFAGLSFAADTQSGAARRWENQVRERLSAAGNELVFFDVELKALSAERLAALRDAPELAEYRHYFERVIEYRPHTLSEEVEQVLATQRLTGRDAFVQLHEFHKAGLAFDPVQTRDGRTLTTLAELLATAHDADEALRREAYLSIRRALKSHNKLFAYILNAVLQDHRLEAQKRGYAATLDKQLMEDEVPRAVFRQLMDTCQANYGLFHRYYRVKARALGKDRLDPWDIYAPSVQEPRKIDEPRGEEVVVQALEAFHPRYAEYGKRILGAPWIDSAVRAGKRGGAFCWPVPGHHSYLLMSYTEDYHSLFTLAHELGHGIHFAAIDEHQRPLVSDPPMVLAEVGSIFNELLLLDHLLATARDQVLLRQLLTQQIEEKLNLIFRQTSISRLEEDLHEAAATHPIDHELVNAAWGRITAEVYGDALRLDEWQPYSWANIGHIYFKPFYCYNYCLSFLISLALYVRYKQVGPAFGEDYLRVLSSGGSAYPIDLLASVGIDLTRRDIIQGAFDYVSGLINKLEGSKS